MQIQNQESRQAKSLRERRLTALQNQIRRVENGLIPLHQLSDRYALARFSLFAAGILAAIAIASFYPWKYGLLVWAAFLAGFVWLVLRHNRLQARIKRGEMWAQIKREHAGRIALEWDDIPLPHQYTKAANHPFAVDIDLIGSRSLCHLLDATASNAGSALLQSWLMETAPQRDELVQRQAIVAELIPRPLFRDKLSLAGRLAGGSGRWDADQLQNWLSAHPDQGSFRPWVLFLGGFAALNFALFILDLLDVAPPIWQIGLLAYFAVTFLQGFAIRHAFREAAKIRDLMEGLAAIFALLERPPHPQTPALNQLRQPFREDDRRPSDYFKRMGRITAAASFGQNAALWLLANSFFPWDFFNAYRLQREKERLAAKLPAWLAAYAQLETLSAFATFAYLNPDSVTFPTLLPQNQAAPIFSALKLGHPLLPYQRRVTNDLTIAKKGQALLLTGSNMSGKSAFLRTIGLNLALANAGSPVMATHLQTPIFRLYTAINVTDSVTDGISYFYAEVKRLKALLTELESAHPRPLFFLIDEIFRGTNNQERLAGSRAYVQALTHNNGVGIISTHDLELTKLATENDALLNYHFRDHIVAGKMGFDYTLRPGACPTTNALKIMALEGLPLPPQDK